MKYITLSFIFALLFSPLSYSKESDIKYQIHLASYHFDRSKQRNEENYGIGIEYGKNAYLSTGYYFNSDYKDTFYLVGGYDIDLGGVTFGYFGGAATGYREKASFIGGFRFTYNTVSVLFTPTVLTLSLRF